MNNEIKKRLDAIGNKQAIQLFFRILKKMLNELNIDAENEKLAINVRNDYRKRISVNLNSHLVLSIKEGDEFGFKINEEDLALIENTFHLISKDNFAAKKLPAVFIHVKYSDLVTHHDLIESLWLKSCKTYEPMIARSRYRKHHIPELFDLAFDHTLLNHYLNDIPVPTNTFKDIINELAVYLKAEDNVLSDFEINKDVFTDTYVWISDGLKIIGDLTAHYEIINDKNRLYTSLHFESKVQKEKDIFSKSISALPANTRWITWQKSKSLQYDNAIAINDPQVLQKLADQLLYLENNLGDTIRNILQQIKLSSKSSNKMPQPLNQILFGPPGTGKTYNTINKAIAIANPGFDLKKTRKEIKAEFDRLIKEKQVVFTTFHQSMSYEDFIEGIKPLEPKVEGHSVNYKVVDGIFKAVCREAARNDQFSVTIDGTSKTLTKELFEEFYYSFSQTLPDIKELKSPIELRTKENYPFELFKNSMDSIAVKAGLKKSDSIVSFNELSLVLFENKLPTYKSYEQIIINKILEDKNFKTLEVNNSEKNYVLIVDEINRGNVSQIFGELIALIEKDKRIGKEEALKAMLPYSKEMFGVPPNLYIIGTMNTADRSVEALDAALRRRFSFEEMPPKAELIDEWLIRNYIEEFIKNYDANYDQEPWAGYEEQFISLLNDNKSVYEEWDHKPLQKVIEKERSEGNYTRVRKLFADEAISFLPTDILRIVNRRIEKLLDKDHQVGHSYFMSIDSLGGLKNIFQKNIIPLLQEYFFGDYGKIGLVLGKDFFEPIETADENLFAAFDDYDDTAFIEKPVYRLKDILSMNDDDFIRAIDTLLKK